MLHNDERTENLNFSPSLRSRMEEFLVDLHLDAPPAWCDLLAGLSPAYDSMNCRLNPTNRSFPVEEVTNLPRCQRRRNNAPRGATGRSGRGGAKMRHSWSFVGCTRGRRCTAWSSSSTGGFDEGLSHHEAGRRLASTVAR